MIKSKFLATLAAIGLATATLVGIAAPAAATPPTTAGLKVYVCKYTITPGGVEKLQTGQNPIEVSVNAINPYNGVGSYFNDAQGRSFVLGEVPMVPEPTSASCPAPTPPDVATASVSTTPATCELAEALVLGAVVNATWGAVTDPPGPNDYDVTATADSGAEFAGGLTTKNFTGTLDPPLTQGCDEEPDLATASLAFIPATCDAAEQVDLGNSSISNATWGALTDPPTAEDYDVTATANSGAEFAGGSTTKLFTGMLDPQLTGEGCEGPLVATASLAFTPASCSAAEQVDLANSSITNATWGSVTDPPTAEDFEVTATADSGAEFAGNSPTKFFTGFLDPMLPDDHPDCLETLGPVQPSVTFKQITCDADGSYTLGSPTEGDADKLVWTVNGLPNIPSGTYAVTTSKTVTVVAGAIPPDVVEFDWVDPAPFEFEVPTGCELETLALTGSNAAPPWALNAGIGVLVLGAGMLLLRRRQDALFE
jgi:hypothetical protein